MIKINPFLNKKLFGIPVCEYLGILCGSICGGAAGNNFHIENPWIEFGVWCLAWILGVVLFTIVISLIKTFITKEE